MTDVYDRVNAVVASAPDFMSDKDELLVRSPFGRDASIVPFRTYDVIRTRWATGLVNLKVAAELSLDESASRTGVHLIALRSSLLATSKGLWVSSSSDSEERVSRAAGLVIADRHRGQLAMHRANQAASNKGFSAVAGVFEKAEIKIADDVQMAGLTPIVPPNETAMTIFLGDAIDEYYGYVGTAKQDALVLWHASSSLSHGERWFADLGKSMAQIVTERSLDVVCSGLNLLWLKLLFGTSQESSSEHFVGGSHRDTPKDSDDLR